jgi:hypothetical protein
MEIKSYRNLIFFMKDDSIQIQLLKINYLKTFRVGRMMN